MSYCRNEGKDKIMFLTKEELDQPSKITLPEDEEQPGLILPSGEINWACPCLGGMATGPCGVEFRDAFSCFHYSSANPKGSDCYDMFKSMQECMSQYPVLYSKSEENNDNGDGDDEEEEEEDDDEEDDKNTNISLPQTPVELHDREQKIMTSVEDNTSTLSDKHS